MKRFNKAFTLSELLIALGVIGILCAILLPVIFNLMPNQNTMMAKRAYYIVQSVVADTINDEACYPDKSSATTADKRLGFDDGYGYSNCTLWGGSENTGTIETEGDASLKFATLFVDKLDKNSSSIASGGGTFSTKDGMNWKLSDSGFNSKPPAMATLVVDVNGTDAPNCGQSSTSNVALGDSATLEDSTKCANRTSGFDRFTMNIYEDGRITVSDSWAQSAIKINKDVTE